MGAEVIFSSHRLLSQERSAIILNLSSKQITERVVAERLCTALIGKHDAFPLAFPEEGPFEFRKCVNDLFCNKTGVVTTLHAKHTAMPYIAFMLVVIETSGYLADAKDVGLTEDERRIIVDYVAGNPDAGVEMKGTGGDEKKQTCRKLNETN